MFSITPQMEQAWAALNKPKATTADIAAIESVAGVKLPAPYVEFVQRYGFVTFGRDPERRWAFSYALEGDGQREIREDVVAYLFKTEKVVMALRNMTASTDPDDEALPSIPPGYLPIGSNLEEGTLLLDIGDRLGQIWFWPQSDWRWGTEGNTRLGFVANDLLKLARAKVHCRSVDQFSNESR